MLSRLATSRLDRRRGSQGRGVLHRRRRTTTRRVLRDSKRWRGHPRSLLSEVYAAQVLAVVAACKVG